MQNKVALVIILDHYYSNKYLNEKLNQYLPQAIKQK